MIGLIGLVWGSLGFTQAGQHAMAQVWNVPGVDRPGFFPRLVRGVSIIGVLGLGVIATTIFSGFGFFNPSAPLFRGLTMLVTVALNVAISMAAFRLLTPKGVATRDLVPGAVLFGLAWSVLQLIGGYLISQRLEQTSEIYGLFAVVLGLIFWLYLGAQISLYTAELNVVLARRLYPRSIVQPPLTEPDRQALRELAEQEERRPEERVRVDFVDEVDDRRDRQERTRAGSPRARRPPLRRNLGRTDNEVDEHPEDREEEDDDEPSRLRPPAVIRAAEVVDERPEDHEDDENGKSENRTSVQKTLRSG